MLDRRALWTLPLAAGLSLLATYWLAALSPPDLTWPDEIRGAQPTPPTAPEQARSPESSAPPAAAVAPRTARWIAAGGGSAPEYNQVQLEQDLALAVDVFGARGPGVLLYASGPGSRAVQVLRTEPPTQDLRARLASLFDPREGRDSRYRSTSLAPVGAASRDAILEALRGALGETNADPLTLYLAGHGLGGEEPAESRFLTWGAGDLWVTDLADALDEAGDHRPVRVVVTSCYGGGFAEIAFHRADANEGEAQTDRCGFFATTWDRAAAGCDPNPDRGTQEGYGIHFLHALEGEDRAGGELASVIDADDDGAISMLEAHSWARVASASLDVPVTTSERFLRAAVEASDTPLPEGPEPRLPEEAMVIERLATELGLNTRMDVTDQLTELEGELRVQSDVIDGLDANVASAHDELAAGLLHRWPVLDDPWHPDFEATLEVDAAAIEESLAESATAARLAELEAERDAVAETHDDLLVQLAQVERLARAHETVELSRRLAAEGGRYWLRYQSLLTCERGRP